MPTAQSLPEHRRPTTAATAVTAGTAPAPSRRARIERIDLMPVSLFFLVLAVHAIGTINFDDHQLRGMLLIDLLMHFTRYGFVFVTGFVLFLGYHGRAQSPVEFWRRRFGLVVLPYLLWTVIYTVANAWLLSEDDMPSLGALARGAADGLIRGDAKYQLYFLLITMQIYLFFPLLSAIVAKTAGHHGKLLAAAAAIQVGAFLLVTYAGLPSNRLLAGIREHAWKSLPVYLLFLVGGALAAVHFDRFDTWVRRHTRAVVAISIVIGVATVAVYLRASGGDEIAKHVYSAANPLYLPWFLAGTALLYLASTAMTDSRQGQTGRMSHLISVLSIRAFGVFAVHPLMIDLIHKSGFVHWLYDTFPDSTLPRSLLLTVVTLIASLAVVELILHLPFSEALAARPRIPLRHPPSPPPEAGASAPADAGPELSSPVPDSPEPDSPEPDAQSRPSTERRSANTASSRSREP